ncbi:MAG: ribonuclease P protein component [Acidiferrobacterales bacterium]
MIPVPRFGFPRSKRLLSPAQYSRVFDGRCRVANESFTVYALTNECNHPRLGLVVGKKAARKAVDRNRIKRIIREVFRSNATGYASLDMVVITKAAAVGYTGALLSEQLTNLFSRVNKKCANSSSV